MFHVKPMCCHCQAQQRDYFFLRLLFFLASFFFLLADLLASVCPGILDVLSILRVEAGIDHHGW